MIKQHITINSTVKTVFDAYANVASWPEWDIEVSQIHLPQGLVVGATGYLKPRSGPKAMIAVTEVTPNSSFTVQTSLPLCKMQFGHELTTCQGGVLAEHWVDFSGPLAFLFRRIIGKEIGKTLPSTLLGLKQFCESASAQS